MRRFVRFSESAHVVFGVISWRSTERHLLEVRPQES
jgi:hypothetical protein